MNSPTPLIVGIGSPYGDDQIGWLVVDQLKARVPMDHFCLKKANSPSDLLDWLSPGDPLQELIVCDACRGGGPIGEIRGWSWPTRELERVAWSGTHDLCLPDVLLLAQTLGKLPASVRVWAIEGRFPFVEPSLSTGVVEPVVLNAIAQVAKIICSELSQS